MVPPHGINGYFHSIIVCRREVFTLTNSYPRQARLHARTRAGPRSGVRCVAHLR